MTEKNVTLSNAEEDNKKLLARMLGHLREIKETRTRIRKIEA